MCGNNVNMTDVHWHPVVLSMILSREQDSLAQDQRVQLYSQQPQSHAHGEVTTLS